MLLLYYKQQMTHSTLLSMLILIAVCIDKRKNNICLLSCCSQQHSTPKVITGCYIITHAVHLVRPLKVRYHIVGMFGRESLAKCESLAILQTKSIQISSYNHNNLLADPSFAKLFSVKIFIHPLSPQTLSSPNFSTLWYSTSLHQIL